MKRLDYCEQIVRMNGPALMLDWLGPDYATREELLIRGYDLPCYPYKESYRVASGFFLWLESDRCPGIVNKLNAAVRKRTYKDEAFFKQEAGSTIDELWEDYVKEMKEMKEMRDSKKI